MELKKKERKKLISKISYVSGIAQYALEAKMTDAQVIEAAENLKSYSLIKAANDYNRYCQSQKTAEANSKLKQFVDINNSEIYKLGQWLGNALSKNGQERKQVLLEKKIVHKDDYNQAVGDLKNTIDGQKQGVGQQTLEATTKIHDLEQRIDTLQQQQAFIQEYITNNYGINDWRTITKYVKGG